MSQTPDSILQAGLHPTFDQIGKNFGSSALPGKMFLVSIVENNKFDAYFRLG